MKHHDVIIVGGGIVGSVCAAALAESGRHVTVLERHAAVPDLLRGELIMPSGVDILDKLGLGDTLRDVCLETHGVVMHHHAFDAPCHVDYDLAPCPLERTSTTPPHALCGWRQPMYTTLRQHVAALDNVEWHNGFDVVDVERLPNRSLKLRARDGQNDVTGSMLIAADGANSRLRRRMGFEPLSDQNNTWVQGFIGRAPNYTRQRVHVGTHDLGAAFVFPFPGGYFRCTIEVHDTLRPELRTADPIALHLKLLREALPEIWDELGGPHIDIVSSKLHAHPGRSMQLASLVEDGFALIGDAAGCLDPFTGFGMATGLADAVTLAQILDQNWPDVSAKALRAYERQHHAMIAPRREATDLLTYAYLDKTEGFADTFAKRIGLRWSDKAWILPLVAAQFAGYDPPLTPSPGMHLHVMGLL